MGNRVKLTTLAVFVLIINIFSHVTFASTSTPAKTEITIESIKQDHDLLRTIAEAILARPQEKANLKQKVCKHSTPMYNVWASGKKWSELTSSVQSELTIDIPKTQVQSILRRPQFVLLSDDVLSNSNNIVQKVILTGTPVLNQPYQSENEYALMISVDLAPTITGKIFKKIGTSTLETSSSATTSTSEILPSSSGSSPSLPKLTEENTTKAYVSFNITDIIKKIIEHQDKSAWDKGKDGAISTFCNTD